MGIVVLDRVVDVVVDGLEVWLDHCCFRDISLHFLCELPYRVADAAVNNIYDTYNAPLSRELCG